MVRYLGPALQRASELLGMLRYLNRFICGDDNNRLGFGGARDTRELFGRRAAAVEVAV